MAVYFRRDEENFHPVANITAEWMTERMKKFFWSFSSFGWPSTVASRKSERERENYPGGKGEQVEGKLESRNKRGKNLMLRTANSVTLLSGSAGGAPLGLKSRTCSSPPILPVALQQQAPSSTLNGVSSQWPFFPDGFQIVQSPADRVCQLRVAIFT